MDKVHKPLVEYIIHIGYKGNMHMAGYVADIFIQLKILAVCNVLIILLDFTSASLNYLPLLL